MGKKIKHFLFLISLLSCCLAAAAAAAGIGSTSTSDAAAIADLARSLARPPSTWPAAGGDACSFKGITCSAAGRVTAIDLAGEGLAGTLPPSLSNLTALESLQLQGNALSGAVPPLRSPALARLSLDGNAFTSIPGDFLLATPALQILTMDGLPLPPWPFPAAAIAGSPSLHTFSASNTNMTGPFPAAIDLTSIRTLLLSHNNLTGVIPASLGKIGSLTNISLSYNFFQGPVPEFAATVAVDDVIAGNGFCLEKPGPCDAQVSTLLQVAEGFGYPLHLARSWTGNEPCSGWEGVICTMSDVEILGLTEYNLSGTISPAIGKLTGLQKLNLANNNLTGEIPDALTALPNLVSVDVRNNRLCGQLPKFRASVDVLADGNCPSLRSHHGSGQVSSLDDGSSSPSGAAADASSKFSAGTILGIIAVVLVLWKGN